MSIPKLYSLNYMTSPEIQLNCFNCNEPMKQNPTDFFWECLKCNIFVSSQLIKGISKELPQVKLAEAVIQESRKIE